MGKSKNRWKTEQKAWKWGEAVAKKGGVETSLAKREKIECRMQEQNASTSHIFWGSCSSSSLLPLHRGVGFSPNKPSLLASYRSVRTTSIEGTAYFINCFRGGCPLHKNSYLVSERSSWKIYVHIIYVRIHHLEIRRRGPTMVTLLLKDTSGLHAGFAACFIQAVDLLLAINKGNFI